MHTVEWIANRKNKAQPPSYLWNCSLSCRTPTSSFRFWIVRPKFTLKMKSKAGADENKQFGLEGYEAEGAKSSKKVA